MKIEDKDIKRVVPPLRFPEFRDAEGWPYQNGSILFQQTSNRTHNSDLPILAITQEHGAIPRNMIDYNVTVTEKSLESYKVVEKGDFIISLRSFQGGIEYSAYTGICSPAYIILRNRKDICHLFYAKYFKSHQLINDLNKNLEGIRDGKMVSYKQFSELLLPYPKNNEQQKIAYCLCSLDDLISAVTDKIEALKEYKKGLMQQLFPAEGKTTPTLRFPEFQNAGEWENTTLGAIGDPMMCKRILKEQTTSEIIGNIPFYKIGTFGGVPDAYIPKYIFDDYRQRYPYPNKGDILISAAGTIGRLVIFDGKPAYFQDSNIVWIGNTETKILNIFLYYVYQTLKWQTSDGGIVSRLYNNDLKNMIIFFPSDQDEQLQIVNCLSSVDKLISSETDKLDQLKTHKKGLMQQLFPTINK